MNKGKVYNTKQRERILNYFQKHKNSCFSARDIIKNKEIAVGEATVYRVLLRLAREGRIRKFISEKGEGAFYQYNNQDRCGDHFHLKCLKCGETVHMDCSFMTDMEQHIKEDHDFIVDNTQTVLYGLCKLCNTKHY